jgi:hypothetical protein
MKVYGKHMHKWWNWSLWQRGYKISCYPFSYGILDKEFKPQMRYDVTLAHTTNVGNCVLVVKMHHVEHVQGMCYNSYV